jgi:4-carboxymuconolactone decarboxylase
MLPAEAQTTLIVDAVKVQLGRFATNLALINRAFRRRREPSVASRLPPRSKDWIILQYQSDREAYDMSDGEAFTVDHGRLHWFRPEELNESQSQLYERIVAGPRSRTVRVSALTDSEGRLQGPFNAFLIDPVVGEAVENLGAAIRYRSSLTARSREIATLVVAREVRSNYEWLAHSRLALASGLAEDEISAILDERAPETFDAQERQIWEVTRMLLKQRDLDDEMFARARGALGNVLLMELIVLVGHYELIARSLQVWRVPLPQGAEKQFME